MDLEAYYQLPDDGVRHELVNGWLVSEPAPGVGHGRVAARLVSLLDAYVRQHGSGVVLANDTGFILHRSPDTVRAPDVAFIRLDRFRALEDEVGPMPGPPDLAVEVLSPSNRLGEMHGKVADYLAAGAIEVWVVDPQAKRVDSYRELLAPVTRGTGDVLEVPNLLPGFSIRVDDIFALTLPT